MEQNQKNLTRRYLIWCYKTTKEDLDRIDRYFTQGPVDEFLLKCYKEDKDLGIAKVSVDKFASYMSVKLGKAKDNKFLDVGKEELQPEYLYLQKRFAALEKAIVHFLGEEELKNIAQAYEDEFTRRIWEAREHT